MSYHQMITKNKSEKGWVVYSSRYVDIAIDGSNWVWREVDENGNYIGPAHEHFNNEDSAKDDALKSLGGNYWE